MDDCPPRFKLEIYKNVVSEYTYERSVADKVNVGYEIYSIRTDVGENGGKIEKGFTVPVRDKKTRKHETFVENKI